MSIYYSIKLSFACLFVLWVASLGCTGTRRIEMKNNTADTVHFLWTLNEDSLLNNPFLLSNSKELKFSLTPSRTNSIKMSFGDGGWSPSEVQKLVGFLTSFEIISTRNRLRIDSLPLLRNFLLSRRRGIGGGRIEIVVMK